MLEPTPAAAQQAPKVVFNWPPGQDVEKTKHVRVRFTYSVIPEGRGATPEPERGWGRRYRRVPPPPSAACTSAPASAYTPAKPLAEQSGLSASPPAAVKAGAAQGAGGVGVASASASASAATAAAAAGATVAKAEAGAAAATTAAAALVLASEASATAATAATEVPLAASAATPGSVSPHTLVA